MKRKLYSAISVLMVLCMLAGCGGSATDGNTASIPESAAPAPAGSAAPAPAESSAPAAPSSFETPVEQGDSIFPLAEKVTFTLMAPQDAGAAEFEDMEMVKRQEERTNVHIEWITVPGEMWLERKNLALASGDLPDALYKAGLTDFDVISYSEQGVLVDLKPFIDQYGTYFTQVLNARPTYIDAITLPNGQIPALPYIEDIGDMQDCQQFWYINKTWLSALGLQKPTTTEEFMTVMTAFKNDDPNGNGQADEIPLTFRFTNEPRTDGLYYIFGSFGEVDNPQHIVLKDNTTFEFTANTDGYKEGIKYLNQMYTAGLLDPEGFSQDAAQYTAKARMEPNVVGSLFTWRGDNLFGLERHEQDYELLEPLKGPTGLQNWGGFLGDPLIKNTFAITSQCADPATLFRWADSLYEPEFAVQWNWGIIYQKNEKGIFEAGEPPEGLSVPEFRSMNTAGGYAPTAILNEYYGVVCEWQPSAKWRVDTINEVYRKYMPDIIYSTDNSGQPFGLTPDEVLELADINTAMKPYIDEMKAKWIAEGGVDEDWEDYLRQLEIIGVPRLLEIYQAGYDRFRGN